MHHSEINPGSLTEWLAYLEKQHPELIEMGLERVNKVRLGLGQSPSFPLIVVGGTNGKGSVCRMLESILSCAGYKVGCYTSPHLVKFNERIRIHQKEVNDESLIQAFDTVDKARLKSNTSLTFFEFGTLAAMQLFIEMHVDVAILEIGLGGRLDAVNIFDTDCAVLTSVDIDHIDYLGDTRDQIGSEKVAIFRRDRPAICAETDLPLTVLHQVENIGANFIQINKEFGFLSKENQWDFWGPAGWRYSLPYPALRGVKQLQNASACLAALDMLVDQLPVSMNEIRQGLLEATLPGRFQVIANQPLVVLDVAHNPAAAHTLSINLDATKPIGYTYAVFAMLHDKDIQGVIQALKDNIDIWLVSSLDTPRGAQADSLINEIECVGISREGDAICKFSDPVSAFVFACERATKNDRICIFGSFHTVGAVLQYQNIAPGK